MYGKKYIHAKTHIQIITCTYKYRFWCCCICTPTLARNTARDACR